MRYELGEEVIAASLMQSDILQMETNLFDTA